MAGAARRALPRRAGAARASAARRGGGATGVRIAVVEPVGKGGLIHYAFQLCRALAAEGAEVTLVTGRDFELEKLPRPFELRQPFALWDPKPERDAAGPRARRLRRWVRGARYLAAWVRIARALRRLRADWVLLSDLRFAADLAGVALLVASGQRLADVCHNVEPLALAGRAAGGFRSGRATRAIQTAIYRRMDRVLVHYESNRARFLSRYRLPPERVSTIPHGDESLFAELADPRLDAAALRVRIGLPAAAPVVLLLGSLSGYKGVDLLLEAFARVAARRPDARLVLAGFPTPDFDLDEHRRRATGLGLAERVTWAAGYVPATEVAAWLRLAAVAVFPYREVSQSGALALAATFAVPVVASRVGALPEMLEEGAAGLLVAPGEIGPLADAILALLDDPARAAA
ncbi:MAG: glycosyltransferase family 4 protein, partial [Thermoanaerobaculia bacterium]